MLTFTNKLRDYEFVEREDWYELTLNGRMEKIYPKRSHSKQEAEQKAADVVNKAFEKYGCRIVRYYGLLTPEDFKDNY